MIAREGVAEIFPGDEPHAIEHAPLARTIGASVQTAGAVADIHTPIDKSQTEWEYEEMFRDLDEFFALIPVLTSEDLRGKSRIELTEYLTDYVENVYNSKEQMFDEMQGEGTMRDLERWMALRAVNARWMEHLANMDYLREGINLRGYEQKDPLLIYQKEAFDEFAFVGFTGRHLTVRTLAVQRVEADFRLPLICVLTVAVKAVFRQNWPNIATVRHRSDSARRAYIRDECDHREGKKPHRADLMGA